MEEATDFEEVASISELVEDEVEVLVVDWAGTYFDEDPSTPPLQNLTGVSLGDQLRQEGKQRRKQVQVLIVGFPVDSVILVFTQSIFVA